MCLPDFKRFEQISENNSIIGYRSWRNDSDSLELISENQNYIWIPVTTGPHEVLEKNSGIYAYNYNTYNTYNYYNNYNYYINGIIKQFGKVAIHKIGQRSEFAKVDKLFTIRELDADGPIRFLEWIKKFNNHIYKIAERYEATTINWQDFVKDK